MKSTLKKLVAVFCALCLMMAVQTNAFAANTVTYSGSAKEFVFEPKGTDSPADLFSDFKEVMPGDSLTQKILIKNDVDKNVKIRLYLKSTGANEGSADFLSKLKLTVTQDGKSKLYDAPADQTDALNDWAYLGTFYSGAEILLDVTLDVPIELDDKYQEASGSLDWQFKVEELPVEPDDPKPPQTRDTANVHLYVALAAISAFTLVMLLVLLKRKKR